MTPMLRGLKAYLSSEWSYLRIATAILITECVCVIVSDGES